MFDELVGKKPNEFTLMISGREIVVQSARLLRTMDTVADALTVTMPWFPGQDEELDRITAPYSYSPCAAYIGGKLQMIGTLYNVKHSKDIHGTVKEFEIFTRTADIIDSTVLPPYEANNISLTDRCKQQCKSFGISVIIGDGVNLLTKRTVVGFYYKTGEKFKIPKGTNLPGLKKVFEKVTDKNPVYKFKQTGIKFEEEKFQRVSAEQTETIFDHLRKLAAQRGVLLSCTKWGDLLITKSNTGDNPVGTIEEDDGQGNIFKAEFNGRDRFQMYRAIVTSCRAKHPVRPGSALDTEIKAPRILTFQAPDIIGGQGINAAEWRKRKHLSDANTLPFPVNSWYAPNKKIWEPNTTVIVKSPTLGQKKGFTYLISRVEFQYENTGVNAILQLKPPEAYTLGETKVKRK